MAKKPNGVWRSQLDRFGYTLTVIAETEERAHTAMMRKYCRVYAKTNNVDENILNELVKDSTAIDKLDDAMAYELSEFSELYSLAKEEAQPSFLEFDKVYWE